MTISTADGLIEARAASSVQAISKATFSTFAGSLYFFWNDTSHVRGVGQVPGAAAICTNSLAGSIWKFTNPTDPTKTYLDSVFLNSDLASTGAFVLYDRLSHMGGIDGTVTTAQTVDLTLPTDSVRCDQNGVGVEWCIDFYAASPAVSVTATVTYTNSSGTTGRTTTVAVAASLRARTLLRIMPSNGDIIKSIQSIQFSGSLGAVGSMGITARKRIIACPITAAGLPSPERTSLMIRLADDACGEVLLEAGTTTSGNLRGHVRIVQG